MSNKRLAEGGGGDEGFVAPQLAFNLAPRPGEVPSVAFEDAPTTITFAPTLASLDDLQGMDYVPGADGTFSQASAAKSAGNVGNIGGRGQGGVGGRRDGRKARFKRNRLLVRSLAFSLVVAAAGLLTYVILDPEKAGFVQEYVLAEKKKPLKAVSSPLPVRKKIKDPERKASKELSYKDRQLLRERGGPSPLAQASSLALLPQRTAYHNLPNFLTATEPLERIWTAQEEEVWRSALAHKFPWQHYKAVLEVKEKKLLQSQVLLWDALADKSFWTRMYALMGLAEFGVPVAARIVGLAVEKESEALVANFFKRFYQKNSPGERFIMRQALERVGPRARFHILRILAKIKAGEEGEVVSLYLVAALQDKSPVVRRLAKKLTRGFGAQRLADLNEQLRRYAIMPAQREEIAEPVLLEKKVKEKGPKKVKNQS